ncbi:MAG: RodZ domain-containing protein [Acidimicrobiales bacterium]
MPGRPRNDDRRAIEAFARIHQGTAGSTRSSPRRNALTSPGASRFVPDPAPAEPVANGYAALPALPNLDRPRIGRRVAIAAATTAIVLAAALGFTGATGTQHRGSAHLAAATRSATRSASRSATRSATRSASRSRSPSGSRSGSHSRSAASTAGTAATGPVSPTSSSPTQASYVLPASDGPLAVTITATSGACWAEAGPSSGRPLSWEGTIDQGLQHTLTPASQWWLRLGAPEYVAVSVNGRQLELPVTSQPLDLSITTS